MTNLIHDTTLITMDDPHNVMYSAAMAIDVERITAMVDAVLR